MYVQTTSDKSSSVNLRIIAHTIPTLHPSPNPLETRPGSRTGVGYARSARVHTATQKPRTLSTHLYTPPTRPTPRLVHHLHTYPHFQPDQHPTLLRVSCTIRVAVFFGAPAPTSVPRPSARRSAAQDAATPGAERLSSGRFQQSIRGPSDRRIEQLSAKSMPEPHGRRPGTHSRAWAALRVHTAAGRQGQNPNQPQDR
jgi:hypothetical protein